MVNLQIVGKDGKRHAVHVQKDVLMRLLTNCVFVNVQVPLDQLVLSAVG